MLEQTDIDFYPRPPRGGRQLTALLAEKTEKFLSTPSARRATYHLSAAPAVYPISIHALREEGDLEPMNISEMVILFLSTPSARRATRKIMKTTMDRGISIHALREEGDTLPPSREINVQSFLSTPSARRATF